VASTGQPTEPSPDERERALGYNTGATAAPSVTEQQRHTITGRCMDAYAMQSLLALCLGLRHAASDILPALGDVSAVAVPPAGSPPCLPVQSDAPPVDALPQVPVETPWRIMMRWGWRAGQGLGPTASGLSAPTLPLGRPASARHRQCLGYHASGRPPQASPASVPVVAAACEAGAAEVDLCVDEPTPVPLLMPAAAPMTAGEHLPCYALAVLAEAVEGTRPAAPGDVWSDDAVLHYLQQDAYASGSSHAQRRRVRKRARMYRWQSDKLYRVMADSSNRQVPPPAQRLQLVKDTHAHTGHFGEKRTMSLLCNGYW
jgi:hypothetical protein